jgi:Xaa-Pro aminopeptidase
LLLAKQKLLIADVKPGVSLIDLDRQTRKDVFDILKQIGVVRPDAECTYRVANLFCPHGVSHHIGVSVHDYVAHEEPSKIEDSEDRTLILAPGMVVSVEPGIYFSPRRIAMIESDPPYDVINVEVARTFAKTVCGMRIEDDVVVTETGCEVLSANCPKEIEEIESLMAAE